MEEIDRNQKLAEIKSSIELLEECKEKVNNNSKLDEKTKKSRNEQIDEAIKENYEKARLQFQATKKEVDSVVYNEVTEEYKAKYEARLKAKGLTDEQLHQKEQAVVIVATGEEAPIRKRHRRTKRTELRDEEGGFDPSDFKRLDNEEELMKKSLTKDKKDLERRRHRSTDTMSDKPKNSSSEEVIGTVISAKKIKPRDEVSTTATIEGENTKSNRESMRILEKMNEENEDYVFDTTTIPSYVQYDILPLPSKGECYSHKKNRIPVAYLTAADENIIASPNMYRDGKIIDTILERKILDKDIKVEDLCKGDRDAIVLWLRATGYGTDYPILATNPQTKKEYQINVKLDTFKYYPFNLKGDENGYFDYTTSNGDLIKFKYLSIKEDSVLKDKILAQMADISKFNAVKSIHALTEAFEMMKMEEGDRKELEDCIADIKDIINADDIDFRYENGYILMITNQMIEYTMSVNGNSDKEYIKQYIENMRSKDAMEYRTFVTDNTPGVNMKISVNIPQSDGGGTFDTFLGIDDYVFSNI